MIGSAKQLASGGLRFRSPGGRPFPFSEYACGQDLRSDVSLSNVQYRRLVGLTLVVLVYIVGLIGWTWAVLTVDPVRPRGDSTATEVRHGSPPSSAERAGRVHEVETANLNGP